MRLVRALLAWLGPTGRLVVGGVLLGILLVAVRIHNPFGAIGLWEGKLLDFQFTLRGPRNPATPIVIITIDENSFDDLNHTWPWPRAFHARLIDIVRRGRPLAIGLDIVFAEPSPYGPADDEALGAAVARAGNVVLAASLSREVDPVGGFKKEDPNAPIPVIRAGAAAWGPVNLQQDIDSAVRGAILVHPLELAAPLPGFNVQLLRLLERAGQPVAPLPAQNEVLINYRGGRSTFPFVPYQHVLAKSFQPEMFAGKVVLVGSTTALLHDQFPTPFAPEGDMPGVEINANVLETLVQGLAIRPAPRWVGPGATLFLAVLTVWIAGTFRPLPASALVLGVTVGAFALAHVLFRAALLRVELVTPLAAILFGFIFTFIGNVMQEQREKRRLSRFFSPAVVRKIIRSHDADEALSSGRRVLTVLFSDIRGFTSMSERMAPEQVVEFLREYLGTMTEAVFLHGGTVDKYVGDAIVALYNAPFEEPDHAAQAVRTALEFQERLGPLRRKFGDALGGDLRCGVGIHTGEAVVGALGSAQRLEYTAIGDTINLGSRLEGLTKRFDVPIIISEATYRELKDQFHTRALGEVGVRGREEPVQVYAVLGPAGALAEAPAAEAPATEVPATPATAAADR